MLTELRIQNFKSWRDTGAMRFAPLTGFFGPNSSGKSSILQFLLMLKQTVESTDRLQVLNLGGEGSSLNLGAFSEILHRLPTSEDGTNREYRPENMVFELKWVPELAYLAGVEQINESWKFIDNIAFLAALRQNPSSITTVEKFIYKLERNYIGIEKSNPNSSSNDSYQLKTDLVPPVTPEKDAYQLTPTKFYGFPYEARRLTPEINNYIHYLEFNFETLFRSMRYLGPLREYPQSSYPWSGSPVNDVGIRGEKAVQALLYSQKLKEMAGAKNGGASHDHLDLDTAERVAQCLKDLDLIDSFSLQPIIRQIYEVRVRQTEKSPEVLLTEVGFGVSQVLPVLTLCYLVPMGSTIILEQPEIHLHPAIQSRLADIFIDVIKNRGVQIILESHSEHLLNRLQRRMAEEQLVPSDVALYFTHMENGESKLEELKIDEYGNISNWPENFFGDEMGDLVAMTEAAIKRQMQQQGQQA